MLQVLRSVHHARDRAALYRGRSQQVWLVESRDADDRVVSRGQVRLQNLT